MESTTVIIIIIESDQGLDSLAYTEKFSSSKDAMSKSKHNVKPASDVVARLGGCRSVAKLMGVSPSAVSRWCTPCEFGGTGGRIPQKRWQHLIAVAKSCGVELDAHSLSGFI